MATQPATSWSPPSGTRDFVGNELRRRNRSIAQITSVFESHGFDPLETPAFERVELLTGKYGEDEKLIFKIAGRGAKKDEAPDLALRYDLTVPLARFAASHRDMTARGLRSYRIGPVWRADRPARGRFREFIQCDIDIVGTDSLIADADVQIAVAAALSALGIRNFTIHINSRKVLAGLAEAYGLESSLAHAFTVALDKLAKIGPDGVIDELSTKGIGADPLEYLRKDIAVSDVKGAITERLESNVTGREGLAEVQRIQELVRPSMTAGEITFDPFTARGLDYYTGPVFEVFVHDSDVPQLSVASGGRYDDLIGNLSGHPVPACGGSLGFERIQLLLDNTEQSATGPDLLVTNWDDNSVADSMKMAAHLRANGFTVEVSSRSGNLGAQLRYASNRNVRAALICGPAEREKNNVTIKNLLTGEQATVPRTMLVSAITNELGAR